MQKQQFDKQERLQAQQLFDQREAMYDQLNAQKELNDLSNGHTQGLAHTIMVVFQLYYCY